MVRIVRFVAREIVMWGWGGINRGLNCRGCPFSSSQRISHKMISVLLILSLLCGLARTNSVIVFTCVAVGLVSVVL